MGFYSHSKCNMRQSTRISLVQQFLTIFVLSDISLAIKDFGGESKVIDADKSYRYNVLFVIFDDLRPALSGYGDKLAQTPHLDKFMQKSYYFNHAYSQQALCAPSRNSMLTGRRPDTLHLYDFYNYWRTFSGNFTTLPQYFKEFGYFTYSIGKIFHPGISSNYSDDYPLSWSAPTFHPKTEKFMNSPVCPDGTGQLKKNLICPVRMKSQPLKTLPDIESIEEAKRFLKFTQNGTKKFFLSVGLHKPHIPFRFPKVFLKRFPIELFENYTNDNFKPYGMPNVAWNPFTDIRKRDDFKNLNISFPFGPIPKLQRDAIRQAYYASVAYVDDLFGQLIKNVNLDNTIVVITSDHGWSLGEHAEWAKYSNFENALRVPLIIYTPEMPQIYSKKIKNIVELVDIFPTIVDLANLPELQKCSIRKNEIACAEGHSIYKLLKTGYDQDLPNRAISQYPRPGDYPTLRPNSDQPKLKNIKIMGYTIRTPEFRYTIWVKFNSKTFMRNWTQIYGEEIYDHRIDTSEEINLVDEPKFYDIRMRLRHRLINDLSK